MAIKDLDFSEILDVSALKRDCDIIFKEDGKRIADVRSDLLPLFRKASTEAALIAPAAFPGFRTV